MARLFTFLSWLHVALALALLTIAALAVPEKAFADPGCLCTPGDYDCIAKCCDGAAETCCDENCKGQPDYDSCMSTCKPKVVCAEKVPSRMCDDKCLTRGVLIDGKIAFDCHDGLGAPGTCKTIAQCKGCMCQGLRIKVSRF